MSRRLRVGAVIPVRNRWRKTRRFLDIFDKQTYEALHVYIVDSNSSDSTWDELAFVQSDKLTVIRASDDDYWAGATNKGVNRALEDGCDYVLTINDDCVPGDDLVRQLVEVSLASGGKIVGSRINYLHDPAQVWSVGAFNAWGTHRLFQLRENDVYEDDLHMRSDFTRGYAKVEMMPGNGVLVHRSVFERIGLFDDLHCPHYHADSEFILRARKVGGYQAIVAYNAVVYNDVATGGASQHLINRPISMLQRRLGLFLSRRSERRLLTLVHFLANYCPRDVRVATFFSYLSHAVLHFQCPRLKSQIDRIRDRVRLVRGWLSFLLVHPRVTIQTIICFVHGRRYIASVNRACRARYHMLAKHAPAPEPGTGHGRVFRQRPLRDSPE